jgi:hypothetical protein
MPCSCNIEPESFQMCYILDSLRNSCTQSPLLHLVLRKKGWRVDVRALLVACRPFLAPQALAGLNCTIRAKNQLGCFVWLQTRQIPRPRRESSAVDWLAAIASLELSAHLCVCLVVNHWCAMVTSSYLWWGYHSNIHNRVSSKNMTTQRTAQRTWRTAARIRTNTNNGTR